MELLESILLSMGINISSNLIWDFIKKNLSSKKTKEELVKELSNYIGIEGAEIKSEKIIDFLIDKGKLCIENSIVYAKEGIEYKTNNKDSNITMKNIVSATDNTRISVHGSGSYIRITGNAEITQNEQGIKFSTGNVNKNW